MTSGATCDSRFPAAFNARKRFVVLLVHEGGPENLSYSAVARFMASELSSRRVIDTLPRWMWLLMVYGVVLPWRTPRERELYASSWVAPSAPTRVHDGASPSCAAPGRSWLSSLVHMILKVPGLAFLVRQVIPMPTPPSGRQTAGAAASVHHCEELTEEVRRFIPAVHAALRERGGRPLSPGEVSIQVEVGYTHQRGSLDAALQRTHLLGNYVGAKDSLLRPVRVEEESVIVLPLYPQYSSLRSAAAFDAVVRSKFFTRRRCLPHFEFIRSYAEHPAYIRAVELHIRAYVGVHGPPDWLFVVFDGLPKRFVLSGDAYQVECQRTFATIKDALSKPFVPFADGVGEAPPACNLSDSSGAHPERNDSSDRATSVIDHRRIFTQALAPSRLTLSYLGDPRGIEEALAPRTARVLNGIATQVRVIEHSSRRESKNHRSHTGSSCGPSGSSIDMPTVAGHDTDNLRRAMMGSLYFVCPGMVVDTVRLQSLVQTKLVAQALACGWEKASVIPSLNATELHAHMLAQVVAEHVSP